MAQIKNGIMKIKEVVINELGTGKNYFIFNNGMKCDAGKTDGDIIKSLFSNEADELYQNFPNVQHNIKGLNMGMAAYPSRIMYGAIVKDAGPFYNEVKNFQLNAEVIVSENSDLVLISFDGVEVGFNINSDCF